MTTPITAPSTNAPSAPYGTRGWEKQYRYDVACGRKRTVPAGPVRAHVRTLLDHGLKAAAIAQAAGVCRATLTHLLRERTTLKRDVADRLLAVTPERVARDRPEPLVPKDGTVRRIHALQALGWTYAHMEQVLRSAGHLQQPEKIVSPRGHHVTRETYDAICDLYATLSTSRGPSRRAAALAAERGWVVPAAWDDDTIDDPDAVPAVPPSAPTSAEENLDEFAFLVRGGEAPDRAARRAGYSSANSLGAVARRHHRGDILRLMAETEYVDA